MAALGVIWADGVWNTAAWNTAIWAQSAASAPTLLNAVIITPTLLKLTFSEAITIGAGGNGGWTVSLSGGPATLSYASGAGGLNLYYTVSRTVSSAETGTGAYTQPGNGVENLAGTDLATIASFSLINNLGSAHSMIKTSIKIGLFQ